MGKIWTCWGIYTKTAYIRSGYTQGGDRHGADRHRGGFTWRGHTPGTKRGKTSPDSCIFVELISKFSAFDNKTKWDKSGQKLVKN